MPDPARLALQYLPVDALEPNPWNPNVMDRETEAKLTAYLKAEGLVLPLVVRPHPEHENRYQILGGEHRWRVCKDKLGYPEVPCSVVQLDDRRAKLLTVNLNELGGDPSPERLAELIHDLNRDTTLADLETPLPYNQRELADPLELLKLPAGLELQLEEAARAHRDGAPKVLTFVMDEAEPVEAAVAQIAGALEGKNRRGRALVLLAQAWLAEHGAQPVADAPPTAPHAPQGAPGAEDGPQVQEQPGAASGPPAGRSRRRGQRDAPPPEGEAAA